jgi:PAS domain S-box-containing protein
MTTIWQKPWSAALGLAVAAGVVVLNFAAAAFGGDTPWLYALDLVVDLAVLGAVIVVIVQTGLQAEARERSVRTAIDETQARLAAVMDSAMDAIISVDENQRVVLFNKAAESIFRCGRAQALGSTLDAFLPARFRAAHRGHIAHFGDTGVTNRRMGDATTLWALRADGEEFPIEASISQASEGGHRLYTVILRDITRRKEYEDALVRQQAELRELSARALEAREEEKTRLARELHDELGQLLTAMKMDLAWLRGQLPQEQAGIGARAAQMDAVLDRTVASVRRIAADLRPLMLDDLGLQERSPGRRRNSQALGHECRWRAAEGALENVERNVANTLYRVLQESLTNVARHAAAKNAWIVVSAESNHVRLEVEDDGRGITDADLAQARSLGLKGMRDAHLGGSVRSGARRAAARAGAHAQSCR